MFNPNNFPPVALLIEELNTRNLTSPELVNHIKPWNNQTQDGVNTNPLLLDSYIRHIENDNDVTTLITDPDINEYDPVELESIPVEVYEHLKRFGLDLQQILQWSSVILKYKTNKTLTLEDGYYITAVKDYINAAAYASFGRNPNSINIPTGRIRYENIISFIKLRDDLRNIGETFDGFQVFCLAENHTTEEIIELIKHGYDIPEIVMYGRLGYRTVEEIETYGKKVPEEWLDLVKDIK